MKKLLVLLLFVFCFLASRGYSQDRWVFVTAGETSYVYYDSETLKYEGNTITLYVKRVRKVDDKGKAKEQIDRFILYCDEYKYKWITSTLYYNDGTDEYFVKNETEYITPDTITEALYRQLCR